MYFSKEDGWRIADLTPIFVDDETGNLPKKLEAQRRVTPEFSVTLKDSSKVKIFKDVEAAPPVKRMKLDLSIIEDPPPPMPRITTSLDFFLTTVDPSGLFEDADFVQHVSQKAPPPTTFTLAPPLVSFLLEITFILFI